MKLLYHKAYFIEIATIISSCTLYFSCLLYMGGRGFQIGGASPNNVITTTERKIITNASFLVVSSISNLLIESLEYQYAN